jgi:hypothetical protein
MPDKEFPNKCNKCIYQDQHGWCDIVEDVTQNKACYCIFFKEK